MEKPKECPKCKSKDVKRIVYGLPTQNYKERDDEILGGCVVDVDILWHCGNCEYEWGKVSE